MLQHCWLISNIPLAHPPQKCIINLGHGFFVVVTPVACPSLSVTQCCSLTRKEPPQLPRLLHALLMDSCVLCSARWLGSTMCCCIFPEPSAFAACMQGSTRGVTAGAV